MKTTTLAVLGLLLMVAPAGAHGQGGGFGLFGDFRGLGLGGWGFGEHHGGFDGLGLGLGLGVFDAERLQSRFENRFDSLKTQYDDGVAGSGDFFTTDEYGRIVDKTELLDDRYGLFVSGVERSIDRLGDLLAKYQADDSLSAARLERIEMWINRVTDRLDTKIDSLTDKQTTLQTNLPTYQSFQTDLSTFLTDIVDAGGGGTSGGASLSSNSLAGMSSSLLAAADSETAIADSTGLMVSSGAVPEPSAGILVLLAGGGISMVRGRRTAR